MGEITIASGLETLGHIRETEGACTAIAVVGGRDVRLGRFANRADAAAAIRAARRATCSAQEPVSEVGR